MHGIDLAQALDQPDFATAAGIMTTAAILDGLLARRTTGSWPPELSDDPANEAFDGSLLTDVARNAEHAELVRRLHEAIGAPAADGASRQI